MDNQILFNLKGISIEIIIIAVIVFILTMLIKWPIKKATQNLEENRRKAINTVIVFIPMLLSFILNLLYFGIIKHEWFPINLCETSGSSYLLSVMLYAIYSRIVAIIKGSKTSSTELDYSKETINFIKTNIKTITNTIKVDEKKLNNVLSEISNLLTLKNEIANNFIFQDISKLEDIEKQITNLKEQENEVKTEIQAKQIELETYQNSLLKKGETENGI